MFLGVYRYGTFAALRNRFRNNVYCCGATSEHFFKIIPAILHLLLVQNIEPKFASMYIVWISRNGKLLQDNNAQ